MPRQGPVDGYKLKPGFLPLDWNPGTPGKLEYDASDTAASLTMVAAINRTMEVVSVGYVVLTDGDGTNTSGSVKFGIKGRATDDDYFVALTAIGKDVERGDRYTTHGPRAGNGQLAWASTADTDTERRLEPGDRVTFYKTAGSGTSTIIPIVVVRPTGQRDEEVE